MPLRIESLCICPLAAVVSPLLAHTNTRHSQTLLGRASSRLGYGLSLAWGGGQWLAAAALPTLSYLSDYAFFLGSGALLLTLPILVEIQRETTVLVMQKQREAEIAHAQEQARQQNLTVVEQVKGLTSLISTGAAAGSQ